MKKKKVKEEKNENKKIKIYMYTVQTSQKSTFYEHLQRKSTFYV